MTAESSNIQEEYWFVVRKPKEIKELEDWNGPKKILLHQIHEDKINYRDNLEYNKCDLCLDENIGQGYRCEECNFDCCLKCFKIQMFKNQPCPNVGH